MVYVFLAEGFEEIEALSVVDILRRTDIKVKTVSITNDKKVEGGHGIIVKSDVLIKDIKEEKIETIVLPGGMKGTKNLEDCSRLHELCDYAYENNKYIAAICAAPSILGKWGYLKGKNGVCFPGFEQKLEGCNCVNDAVVTDGNIITSKGAGTSHLFAFEIVSLLKSREDANELKGEMQYE